jgi:hypothetical protein
LLFFFKVSTALSAVDFISAFFFLPSLFSLLPFAFYLLISEDDELVNHVRATERKGIEKKVKFHAAPTRTHARLGKVYKPREDLR